LEIDAGTSRVAAVCTAPLDADEVLPELIRLPAVTATGFEEPECRELFDRADLPLEPDVLTPTMMTEDVDVEVAAGFDLCWVEAAPAETLFPTSLAVEVEEATALAITADFAGSPSLVLTPP
jgi:hypothetical protein